jgi:molybdopterin adenylyltransferase
MLLAVLTISDRCARGLTTDASGPAAAALLQEAWPGAEIATAIVPDEVDEISYRLTQWATQEVALVVTTGGTGLGLRDRTPEATRAVIDREAPGIAEAMRAIGAASNPLAWLSRGVAGLRDRTLIVNLPGSPRAVQESLSAILPLLRHGLETIAGADTHP